MSDLKTTIIADDVENKVHVSYEYDAEPLLDQNKAERNEFRTYKQAQIAGGLVKVASVSDGDIQRLYNMGYDLLSPDPDEAKRAVLYLQSHQANLLTVTGKPFAKKKTSWQ